jgi:putative transposase
VVKNNTGGRLKVRRPRERCDSGVYHIVLRGINRQDIFYDVDDYQRFLDTLTQMKTDNQFLVYGYCLMSNHVHMIICEQADSISRTMSRIGTSYAWWYNRKYDRSGHVFQGRYGSECVEDDQYLLTVIRYIHNNPVKAHIIKEAEAYQWSSIHAYISGRDCQVGLTETGLVLSIIRDNQEHAILAFREFMKQENEDQCLDEPMKLRKPDGEVKADIERLMKGKSIARLQGMERPIRNKILRKTKAIDGISLRQIARVTGLSVDIIYNA